MFLYPRAMPGGLGGLDQHFRHPRWQVLSLLQVVIAWS